MAAALQERINAITWCHPLTLGGIETRPQWHVRRRFQRRLKFLQIPQDLTGKTVLDIGAWDGFYSFEAERRGARRVLATDSYVWRKQKAGFQLARRVLESKVEDQDIDVLDLSPERVGTFDVVLFLGVLYHMRHPLLAMERVASVAKDHLILETHVDMLEEPRPAMAFYPEGELNGDTSNWCGPNPLMVLAMLKTVGFSRAEIYAGPFKMATSTRMLFHAWK